VNNYDEVLPTGEVVMVAGTPYDFNAPEGASLGDTYLDDCFVELQKTRDQHTVVTLTDEEARYGLRVIATSPEVTAVQTYSPVGAPFLVLEPQFNWANPFGAEWGSVGSKGMVILEPGASVSYDVALEVFSVPSLRGD
jgi:galactose mutarotase-like enzyme